MKLNEVLVIQAQKGAAYGSLGKMCSDCAFRNGTEANNDPTAVEGAAACLASGGQFNCHTKNLTDAGKPCMGFLYARQYFEKAFYTDK